MQDSVSSQVAEWKARLKETGPAEQDPQVSQWMARIKSPGFEPVAPPEPVGFGEAFMTESTGRRRNLGDFTGGVATVQDAQDWWKLVEAGQAGEGATPEQKRRLDQWAEWTGRPKTFMGQVGGVLGETIAFGQEMAAGGLGLFGLGQKAAFKGIAPAVIKESLEKLARKGVAGRLAAAGFEGAAIGVATEVVTGGAGIKADAYQRMYASMAPQITVDEAGELDVLFTATARSFVDVLPAAVITRLVEPISERSGEGLLKLLPFEKIKLAMGSVFGQWMAKGTNRTVSGFRKVIQRAGWNGVAGEMLEERYGDVMRAAAGVVLPEDFDSLEEMFPGMEQLAVEAVSFGVMGGAISGLDMALGKAGPAPAPVTEVEPASEGPAPTASESELQPDTQGATRSEAPESAPAVPKPQTPTEPSEDADVQPGAAQEAEAAPDPHLERVARAEGREASEYKRVEPENYSDAQKQAVFRAGQQGLEIDFVEGLKAGGVFVEAGRVAISSKADPQAIFEHEALHALVHKSGGTTQGDWLDLYAQIHKLDAQGLRKARKSHKEQWIAGSGLEGEEASKAYRAAHPRAIIRGEEGLATRAAELAAYMELLRRPGAKRHIQRLLRGDRSWGERILDYIKSMVNAISNAELRSSLQRRADEVSAALEALTGEEADFSEVSAQVAELLVEAHAKAGSQAEARDVPETSPSKTPTSPSKPQTSPSSDARPESEPEARFAPRGKARKRTLGNLAVQVPETKWVKFVADQVDDLIPIKLLEAQMEEVVGPLNDTTYKKGMLSRGRRREVLRRLSLKFLEPQTKLIKGILKKYGMGMEDISRFLQVRHASSRNQLGIDEEREGPLVEVDGKARRERVEWDHEEHPFSGIPTSVALKEEAEFLTKPEFAEFADSFDAMQVESLRLRLEAGLISMKQYDTWTNQWEKYATFADAEEPGNRRSVNSGTGFQVRGPEFKQAKGRTSAVEGNTYILSVAQVIGGIERAVDNEVVSRFHAMLAGASGFTQVREVTDPVEIATAEDVITYKKDGKEIAFGLNDPLIARALKEPSVANKSVLLKHLGTLTRTLAQMYTTFSPEFMVRNPVRDVQAAVMSLPGLSQGGNNIKKRHIAVAMPGAARALWRGYAGKAPQGKMGEYFEEASQAGALASGPIIQQDYSKMVANLEKQINSGSAMETVATVIDNWQTMADVIENSTRLAVYAASRRAGYSVEDSAYISKEASLNFDRHGGAQSAAEIRSAYAFFGAGVNGARSLLAYGFGLHLGTDGKPKLKAIPPILKVISALASVSAGIALWNLTMGGDDEDGVPKFTRMPHYIKKSNMIIMLPGGGQISWPLPWGWGAVHALGLGAGEMAYAYHRGDEVDVAGATTMVLGAIVDGLAPINPGPIAQMATPTAFDPFAQILTNNTFFGAPLMPPKKEYGSAIPDSERSWRRTPAPFKWFAQTVNSYTGGDQYEEGAVSVSPESVEAVWDAYLGGFGKIIKDTFRLYTDPLERKPSNIPVVRSFYRESNDLGMRYEFYATLDSVEAVAKRKKGRDLRDEDRKLSYRLTYLNSQERKAWDALKKFREAKTAKQRARYEKMYNRAIARYLTAYKKATE